ncbi:meiosis-specific protein ASY2-like [Arabidopsis lyrata subsp. lyrata]|uniref:meiosis-specific protein ASY2-like n=1 Tax=Arabidopsis lyrata subsp. lyrata TaxID=81972 RepID=UPI000A29C061|nr:meiosis-specific protein ASY2-like [Arabidopsis lyrata subsp. lyrata]|eukprot:XP_020876886.1 meiosis-specific protein ASY2-like [Arabidopsis lyrata subsp. lyrata]
MTSDSDRPESPSFDERRSSNDECTRPNDIAGPHYRSTCTLQSLERLKELCRIPPGIMAEAQIADPTESPENHRDGYFCVYEIYFKGCGLTFPLPEALVLYLAALEIALPQLTPNLLRTILGIITIAAEAGYVVGVTELNELLSVRSSSKKTGYFSAYPNANRNIISHLPNKDENWHHPWFLIKKTPASIGNLADFLPSKWSAKPAFVASTLPSEEFIEFFKIILEGETLWNSFTLERFLEANHRLRMSPPGHLHQIPPPPSIQGMSSRALAAKRKMLSKPMAEACEEKKKFLATSIDKKDYSRTLLVDDGSTEWARSVASFRLTPRRDRHDSHSPRRDRSPRRDLPRPPRDDFSNEPIKNLVRRKRDKSSRSDSSPRREKSRARTDSSPRSSPPTEPMGPPRPVDMSSSSQPDSGKTARSASPKKGDSESRDAFSGLKPALVPQVKSLSDSDFYNSSFFAAMEKEGNVFRCFKTRSGSILPDFNKWRPAIRERYLLHAHHSSRAHGELNDMVEHYEGLVLGREKEIDAWKKKLYALEAELSSSTGSKHELEDKVDNLTSELAKIKGELQGQYDQNFKLQEEFSGVQGRLQESESNADSLNNQLIELNAKYKAIAKLRDSELARSVSKARKEVKGRGMELIQGAIRFMQTEKARSDLESDIKEHESNLILLDQIHDTDFSEEQERTELSANLSEKRSRLAALPTSTFNPRDFEEFFTESPPISESGLDWAGSSEAEDVVPPEVPATPAVTPEDGCNVEGGPRAPSDQAPAKEVNETSVAEPGSEVDITP